MEHPMYKIRYVADLLKVPSDRREACVRNILYALELVEFANGDSDAIEVTGIDWIDDGNLSSTLNINGADALTLAIESSREPELLAGWHSA